MNNLNNINILEIFQYGFMDRAFIAGILISLSMSFIGIFIVLKRFSILADALSHISLAGLILGAILQINPLITAVAFSCFSSIGLEKIRSSKKVFSDSILAILLTGGLAVSIVLLTIFKGLNLNITSLLFGSILTISETDILIITFLTIIVIVVVVAFYKKLFSISFDEDFEQIKGTHIKIYNYLIIVLASIVIGVSIQIIGVLLISALMIIPTVSAFQYKLGFNKSLILSVAFGLISTILGLFVSFYAGLPSGATIAIILILMFGLSFLINIGN